jgi:hypothetical protein
MGCKAACAKSSEAANASEQKLGRVDRTYSLPANPHMRETLQARPSKDNYRRAAGDASWLGV